MAFTRAIRELNLPRDFKDILTPEWQEAVKRYEPLQSPKTTHVPQLKRARRSFRDFSSAQSSSLTTEAPQPQALHKKSFKVGDRERTSHGTGTVIEVDDDKYLVDLDGQAALLWEKGWGLKKA